MAGSTGRKHWMMESMAQYPRLFLHLKVNYFELCKTSSNFSSEGKDESDTNYHKLLFCCCSELRGKNNLYGLDQ